MSGGASTVQSLVNGVGLSKTFETDGVFRRKRRVHAVRGVDVRIGRGEAIGVVGESGSGKSTLGRLLLGLLSPTAGEVIFGGQSLSGLPRQDWLRLRQRMQIVFQDPYGSLDPRRRVGSQIGDGVAIHNRAPKGQHASRVADLLLRVGLDPAHAQRYPHEFSGGQRQRIGIARALATRPDFLVADEPISALDVSIQAQIVRLLGELRRDLGLTLLFISHDLQVVRHLCDRVVVLYLGRVMEEGPVGKVFFTPAHPYTRALLSAIPRLRPETRSPRILLRGEPPSPFDPPSGCVFRTRCAYAIARCAEAVPLLRPVDEGRSVACIQAEDIA
jgi:oligopeptide/dipeptide ABC transporter ATP-binding protein